MCTKYFFVKPISIFLAFYLILVLGLTGCKKTEAPDPGIDSDPAAHPLLLLRADEEEALKALIAKEPIWTEIHAAILRKCNEFLNQPLLKRKMTGRRLLSVSRDCIHRIFYLSYAYRMTGDERFLRRGEKEMLAVSGFSDWNPSHFLDVAEMTIGMAIGYDWLYNELPESSRVAIRTAIKTKGLEPSFNDAYNWFVKSTNNWNQVCNTGMTFGALALSKAYPELSDKIITRAITSIELPMSVYQPDGGYPEGYGYWGYGTTMNVLFLQLIEEAFGTDYGLSNLPGFLETAGFLEHMLGVSGKCYNWGDCSPGGSLQPAMFWFAKKVNDPSLLWMENKFLQKNSFNQFSANRLLPALLIWAKDLSLATISEPASKMWIGQGANPVALMRTSWSDPQAIYLGFKAGSPSVNHGHMDIGSFIMEAQGIRWAADFGLQDYESLESKGINVFGKGQDAQRWEIFRYNNLTHNTLTIDGGHQRVDGYAQIDRYSDAPAFRFAISNISSVYAGQLEKAQRGVGIINEEYVVIQDEISTLNQVAHIRWTMMTTATVTLEEHGATLMEAGKVLKVKVIGPKQLKMKTWSTEPITHYDAPNPGTILIGFECELPANTSDKFHVYLVPQEALGQFQELNKPLKDW